MQRICHIFILTVSMDTGAETRAFTEVISDQAMLEGKRGVHLNELSLPTVFLNNKETVTALDVALRSPHPRFSEDFSEETALLSWWLLSFFS